MNLSGKKKLIRVSTIPIALEKLLEGQLSYMSEYFKVIAVSSEKSRLERFGKNNNVDVFFLNLTRKITPLTDLICIIKFIIFLKKQKPDIVHSHTPKAGFVSMIASYIAGVPIRIHTVAGLPLMEATGIKKVILIIVEKITYYFSSKILPNSIALQKYIINKNFTSKEKLDVISMGSSNGINLKYFCKNNFDKNQIRKLKDQLSISDEDFVFLFVGRIVSHKGINELVDSFKKIQKVRNKVKLLLVGDFEMSLDPISSETLFEIRNNKNIIYTGWKNDVREYFCVSNLFVFPSYREGFPNVILQSLSMELPCIASDINGCNEIIKNNYNGLLIKKKDTKALARSMLKLHDNPNLISKFKINSRTDIVQNYDRLVFWEKLRAEYFKLIKNYE